MVFISFQFPIGFRFSTNHLITLKPKSRENLMTCLAPVRFWRQIKQSHRNNTNKTGFWFIHIFQVLVICFRYIIAPVLHFFSWRYLEYVESIWPNNIKTELVVLVFWTLPIQYTKTQNWKSLLKIIHLSLTYLKQSK